MRGFSMNSNGPFLYLYLEWEVREKEKERFGWDDITETNSRTKC